MTSERTIIWDGASGAQYRYWIYLIEDDFSAVPGNYMFAKLMSNGKFSPIYAGETSNLSERFDSHHKMDCIKNHGATHICVHQSAAEEETRRSEESDVIEKWHPPCNG